MNTTPTQNQPDPRAMQAAKEHEQYIRGLKDGPSDGQHGSAIIQRVYGAGQTRTAVTGINPDHDRLCAVLAEVVVIDENHRLDLLVGGYERIVEAIKPQLQAKNYKPDDEARTYQAYEVAPAPADPQAIADAEKIARELAPAFPVRAKDCNNPAEVVVLESQYLNALTVIARLVEERDALHAALGEAIRIGHGQAKDADRVWKAMGMLGEQHSIDDVIQLWKSTVADLTAARAEIERLKEKHTYFREEITFLATGVSELHERFKGDKQLELVADLRTQLATAHAELADWKTSMGKKNEELHRLAAERDGLREDKERVDWLESQYANIRISHVKGASESLTHTWAAPRIRELIDSARRAINEGGSET